MKIQLLNAMGNIDEREKVVSDTFFVPSKGTMGGAANAANADVGTGAG